MAAYGEARDLIEIGAYVPGTNPDVDEAVAKREQIEAFLCQPVHEVADAAVSWQLLQELVQ